MSLQGRQTERLSPPTRPFYLEWKCVVRKFAIADGFKLTEAGMSIHIGESITRVLMSTIFVSRSISKTNLVSVDSERKDLLTVLFIRIGFKPTADIYLLSFRKILLDKFSSAASCSNGKKIRRRRILIFTLEASVHCKGKGCALRILAECSNLRISCESADFNYFIKSHNLFLSLYI